MISVQYGFKIATNALINICVLVANNQFFGFTAAYSSRSVTLNDKLIL
ncbi:hypothetical protein ACTJJF_06395 [Chryseobacterium sp. 22458]